MCPSEDEIRETVEEMCFALEGTADDIWALHSSLLDRQDLYLSAWEWLDAPFRALWKGYLEDYRVNHAIEDGSRLVLPCPD